MPLQAIFEAALNHTMQGVQTLTNELPREAATRILPYLMKVDVPNHHRNQVIILVIGGKDSQTADD